MNTNWEKLRQLEKEYWNLLQERDNLKLTLNKLDNKIHVNISKRIFKIQLITAKQAQKEASQLKSKQTDSEQTKEILPEKKKKGHK